MTALEKILPSGRRWRELWEAQNIQGTHWPSSVMDGQKLTLGNDAAKRTTAIGVKMREGVSTSNILFADPYNAVDKWWCSLNFILDRPHVNGSGLVYLIGKLVDANNYLIVFLNDDGVLRLSHKEGNGTQYIDSTQTSWNAGQQYHVLVSCSTTNGQRMIVDGGTAVTGASNQTAISLIRNISLGAEATISDTRGFPGTLVGPIVMGNDDLTQTAGSGEEALLYKGIPPDDAVTLFTLDEGRGTTVYDRGSGADDGTLAASCSWDYGAVKESVISLDGVNDYAESPAAVDLLGSFTIIQVLKIKSTYAAGAGAQQLWRCRFDGDNYVILYWEDGELDFVVEGAGTSATASYSTLPSMNDYAIYVGTVNAGTNINLYVNGVLAETTALTGRITGRFCTLHLGATHTPGEFDVSSTIMTGIIDQALTSGEIFNLSRKINDWYKLGLSL